MDDKKELKKVQNANSKELEKNILDEEEKLKKPILLLFLYCLTIIFLMISGFFTVSTIINQSTLPNHKINVGKLSMELIERNDTTIKLINSYPMSDEKAKKLKPFLFKINNNGTHPLKYRLKLVDVPYEELTEYKEIIGKDRIDNSKIKYSLTSIDTGVIVSMGLVSQLDNEILYEKNLPAAKVDNFALRLWIDENAGNEIHNKYYAGKMILEINDIIDGGKYEPQHK